MKNLINNKTIMMMKNRSNNLLLLVIRQKNVISNKINNLITYKTI